MRKTLLSLSLAAALLGAGCQNPAGMAGPALLAPDLAASTDRPADVPFRADFIITPQVLFPGDAGYPARCPAGPTNAAAIATGVGRAKHLGHVTEVESACIDFATLLLTLGEFTLTAPNGDQVRGEFEGSASFDPPPPNARLQCTFTITGGTGRFEGASGSGVCVDSRQLGDGTSRIVFDGRITYDASSPRASRPAAATSPAG